MDTNITVDSLFQLCFTFFSNQTAFSVMFIDLFQIRPALFFYTHNKNKKTSFFKSKENIHKKEHGSYYVVSANRLIKPHQWSCTDPATKARGNILQFCEFHLGSRFKHWYKSKWIQIIKNLSRIGVNQTIISEFSEYSRRSQRPKNKI